MGMGGSRYGMFRWRMLAPGREFFIAPGGSPFF
jgi:hypothetical protein